MPTVSAARGCSPTARLRRPQRDRKSRIWKPMTTNSRLIVIGPWAKSVVKSQPTSGRSVRNAGGVQAVNAPAPVGELLASSVFR